MRTVATTLKFDIGDYLKTFSFQETPNRFSSNSATDPNQVETVTINGQGYPKFINEFWTAKQRQAASLHEVAYRACFKPQLPRFFIELLTKPGDTVYDPFSG